MGPVIVVFRTASPRSAATSTSTRRQSANTPTIGPRSFLSSTASSARSPGRDHRGCFGKSWGGYGAVIHVRSTRSTGVPSPIIPAIRIDRHWHDWPNTLNELAKFRHSKRKPESSTLRESGRSISRRGLDDGRVRRFLVTSGAKKASFAEGHAIMNSAWPRRDADPRRLSADCRSISKRASSREALEALAGHIDPSRRQIQGQSPDMRGANIICGWRDQYRIHYGTRICPSAFQRRNRAQVYEFDDNHSDIDYRMDTSLPFLYQALRP
jgi:hypothetical protein